MAPIPVLAALLTLFGTGVALRATNGRLTVVGLGLALLPLPLVGGDAPALLVLAFRTLAVLLALFLLDLGVRRTTPLVGPIRLGGSAELGVVIAAWLIGLLLAASDAAPRGPALALATALAMAVAGLTLLAFGSDTLRLGAGATFVLASGATLVPALGGAHDAALELSLAATLVAVAGVTAWLAMAGGEVRRDLELVDRPAGRPRDRPRDLPRDLPSDLPRDLPRRPSPLLTSRQRRLVAAILVGAALAGAAYVGNSAISGWLQQLGAGGGQGGLATPTPPAATPTFTPLPTLTPTPTATATPAPTVTPAPTPAATPLTYVVVQGDTLGAIARRFGVTVAAIQQANGLTDPGRLRVGQRLVIPRP
jgi:LysM repeat protein